MQVFGRTGASIQGQHFFPSSLQHPLTASVPIVLPCSNAAHVHLYQFSLPAPSARSRASSSLSLSQARREAEEMQLNRSDWSDAEQLRFQRALMSFGVHGLERVKRAAYMTKKNLPQLVNYCTAFLLECRKQLSDESELQYVDCVLEKEGWRLQYAEPSLSRWRKLQSNASVWIKRLRTIQLLEDLLVSARSQDVDVLSLLPKSALRLSAVSAPAPWWNNEHDRVLLQAVFELGYCRYDDIKADRSFRFLIGRDWIDKLKDTAPSAQPQSDKPRPRGRKGKDEDDGGEDGEEEDEDDSKLEDVNASTAEEKERGSEAAEAAGGELIDVNHNEFGIAFPASDQLTKRMRKLVENQRKLWWRRREGQDERERPIRIRRKSRQQATEGESKADSGDAEVEARRTKRARREGEDESERVWSPDDVQQLVSAVLCHGIEKDGQHRIKWEKVADECGKGEDWLPSMERVFLHCLEDHYMQMHSAPLPAAQHLGLPAVTPHYLIPPADGELLSSRLLFFSRLRSRLLVLSPYTLESLLDTHRPPPQQQPPLPPWYEPAAHDLCLLQGVGRWGLHSWQAMVQDDSLRWRRRLSEASEAAAARSGFSVLGKRAAEAEDAADKEVQAIHARVKEEEGDSHVKREDAAERKVKTELSQPLTVSAGQAAGLLHRAQELVTAVYSMAGAAAPLSCTFSALCPLMPAESSAARRKREASKEAAEAVATTRRGKRSRRVRQDVSIHSLPDGELSHSFKYFVPSLTRFQRYLFSLNLPLTYSVSAFDVTPLSVTAVSVSYPIWKPLVRHLKSASSPFSATFPLYLCGDRRDEHKLLAPQRNLYRIVLSASTQQPVLPLWLRGGLTLYDLGRLDGRCQFADDRPDSGGGGGVYVAGVGYRAIRVHQSFVDPNRMARYLCEVVEATQQSRGSRTRDQPLLFGPTVLSASQLPTDAASASSSSAAASDTAASPSARQQLTASAHHRDPPVLFRLTCSDCPHTPLVSHSPQSLWSTVADLIYERADCAIGSRRYGCNGWERFGLTHPVVRWSMERQQGIELCVAYCRQPPMTMQRYTV